MKDKEYIKSYKLFIAWLILFPIIAILPVYLFCDLSLKHTTLTLLFMMVVEIYLLTYIIYKGEYVYWFTGGPSYEEAKAAGSEKRKEFAKAHFDLFGKMTLLSSLYLLGSLLFHLSIYLDIIVISLAIVITTIRSAPIKFNKKK